MNDAEAEVPILWWLDVKSWLIGKDLDTRKVWRQEDKGATEDVTVGWHHWLNGHEFEETPGVGDRQGGLAFCSQNRAFLWLLNWPWPDAKSRLIGKDPDAGKDWEQEKKGVTENEVFGWHHWLNGHEFEEIQGDSEGKRCLACCSPGGCRESDTT